MDIALVGLIAQSDGVKPFDLPSRNCLSLACSMHTWRSMKARFGYQNIHYLYNTAVYPQKRAVVKG
jgi:hypothetical protein